VTLSGIAAVGGFLASIAVIITLLYLARQVRQGNHLLRMQSRESLMNQDVLSLQLQLADTELTKTFYKQDPSEHELLRFHLYLTLFLRQREWEWLLHKDGVFPRELYETYQEVVPLFFGTERTRTWWNSIGKTAIHPEFAAEIDRLLERSPPTTYWNSLERLILEWRQPGVTGTAGSRQ
jgi:hypothetical protein